VILRPIIRKPGAECNCKHLCNCSC